MSSKEVDILKQYMKMSGIDIDKHIVEITNSWPDNPMGFNFIPKDWKKFAMEIILNSQFCTDTAIASRFQEPGALSWRQVSADSGLHILIKKGKPYPGYKQVITYVQIHSDSVTPVSDRDISRQCIYALDKLFPHLAADKWKVPLIVPDREGPRIGVRF